MDSVHFLAVYNMDSIHHHTPLVQCQLLPPCLVHGLAECKAEQCKVQNNLLPSDCDPLLPLPCKTVLCPLPAASAAPLIAP